MRKTVGIILSLIVLMSVVCSNAEEAVGFKTIGEAIEKAESLEAECVSNGKYGVVVNMDGKHIRIFAEMDDVAKDKYEATIDTNRLADRPALSEEFKDYAKMLNIVKTEEITAQPIQQSVLDAYVSDDNGQAATINQLMLDGFDCIHAEVTNDNEDDQANAVLLVDNGIFAYYVTIASTANEYYNKESVDSTGDIRIIKISLAGLNSNAASTEYSANGEAIAEEFAFVGIGFFQAGECIE